LAGGPMPPSTSAVRLSLRDLVSPLSPEQFIENYLLADAHYLSSPNPKLVDCLMSLPILQSRQGFERLVKRFPQISLFGPGGFRSSVPGNAAMDFYNRGDTLYIANAQEKAPEIGEVFQQVAAELGVQPRDLSIELFAGRRNAISTLHYDHDTNFQILLRGQKRWRLQSNRHIRNPIRPNHRLGSPVDEVLAERLPFPSSVGELEAPIEVTAVPGTSLFFPLGYWHEVEASEESLAVNLVIKPPRWVDAIGAAAKRVLLRRPDLRAPLFGAVSRNGSPFAQRVSETFASGLAAYSAAVQALTPEDIACATDAEPIRWSAKCTERTVEETGTGARLSCPELSPQPVDVDATLVPLLHRLVGFKGVFSLDELKTLAPEAPTGRLFAFIRYLKQLGYFEAP
jgi:hypothetical protein